MNVLSPATRAMAPRVTSRWARKRPRSRARELILGLGIVITSGIYAARYAGFFEAGFPPENKGDGQPLDFATSPAGISPLEQWSSTQAAMAAQLALVPGLGRSGQSIGLIAVALIVVAFICTSKHAQMLGLLAMFFVLQVGMICGSKLLFSRILLSEKLGFRGLPAPYLVTALQQISQLVMFSGALLVLAPTPWRYTIPRLTTRRQFFGIIALSASFAMNIGLNNFSLSLLPVSLSLAVRSCLPLSTLLMKKLHNHFTDKTEAVVQGKELMCVMVGVLFTILAVFAQTHGTHAETSNRNLIIGVTLSVISNLSGAANYVIFNNFGNVLHFNTIDMMFYMALPAAIILAPPSFGLPHTAWRGQQPMSDWQIFVQAVEYRPGVVGYILAFAAMGTAYNLVQYQLVQRCSPTHAAFAGNFNRAGAVALSLMFGLEHLPHGSMGVLMVVATLGNFASFTLYSVFLEAAKKHASSKAPVRAAEHPS